MKKLALVLSTIVLLSANCKKDPPFIPDDLLIQIMTDGQWSVTDYKLNGVDKTPDFADWRFKFFSDKSVKAQSSTSLHMGTWDGSQSTMTFSASFPTGSVHPVPLLNGNWHIDQPGTRIVAASQTVGSETRTMRLYRE